MTRKKLLTISMFLVVMGCSGPNNDATNPTEKGASYIAGAILTSAILRAIFNN